ncbi:hypothetical protein BAE44_0013918, partial [Dichanthelium oligosanthes]
LEEIFLRVGSPADLAHASTACGSFRGLITDPSFLRRYRAIHPPLLLGFLSNAGLLRAEPPHPSSAAARAHARAADFSFNDYLPPSTGLRWLPADVRDGRVLLFSMPKLKDSSSSESSQALRCATPCPVDSCMLLPPIPDDLVASVQVLEQNIDSSEFLLVPSGHEEVETSFRVICCTCCVTRLVVFICSSVSGLSPTVRSQCVYGCLYWKVDNMNKLLKLDMNTMEFSTNDLPPDHNDWIIVVVEGGEGKLVMFSQIDDGASVEYYTVLQDDNQRGNGWHMKNTIPSPLNYYSFIIGSA